MSGGREIEIEENVGTPVDVLGRYFDARGWTWSRDGDDEIIATARGAWCQVELRGIWRSDDGVLQFLALPDVRVAADKRAAMYETLGLVNEGMWLGHWELWSQSGILALRHALMVDAETDEPLSDEMAEVTVQAALDEAERYYPVFQFVLWGDKSPADALAAAMIETQGEA